MKIVGINGHSLHLTALNNFMEQTRFHIENITNENYCLSEKLGRKVLELTIKAVESDVVSFADPVPSVLRRSQVTKNTKMFDETVPAYLKSQTKMWFN